MKFTYDDKEDRGECLEYVFEGNLVFKGGFAINENGEIEGDWGFYPDDSSITKKVLQNR